MFSWFLRRMRGGLHLTIAVPFFCYLCPTGNSDLARTQWESLLCVIYCAKAKGRRGQGGAQGLGRYQDEALGTFSTTACDSVLYFSTTLKCLISRGRQKPGMSSPLGKGTGDFGLSNVVSQHFLPL